MEWPHPGPYGYDPYTNTFLPLPYTYYGYGFDVPAPYSSYSVLGRRPPMAGARGRGRGRHAPRGRGGRHAPRQHGGPGLLGSDPSSQPPAQVLQPPPPVAAPVPLLPPKKRDRTPPPPPPPPASSSSPSPQAKTPPKKRGRTPPPPPPPASSSSPSPDTKTTPPVSSDPVKSSHVDVSITTAAANKMDGAQGLSGSSSPAATGGKKRSLLPLDRPAPPLKNSGVGASMAHKDDGQGGDVLGLNAYKARKRLLSKKASPSLPAEEEAKDASRKKSRLGWGQGLAKYENRQYKKDDETTHELVANDGATVEEAASSNESSPPQGSNAEMRVSHVTTSPALFSKGSSRPVTGEISHPGKTGSISSLTKKAVSIAKESARFSRKHNQNLKPDGYIGDLGIVLPKVFDVCKGSPPPEDKSSSASMMAIAGSALASSSQGCDAPADESSMKFTKVQDIPPRTDKVIVKMAPKPKKVMNKNVLSDEETETNELEGSKLKEWSQEEKDVFSEMITTFGTDFCKVSSFLSHKTTEDCMKYYFEHYKSESHKEAQKCLPTTVIQSQENCCHENAAPLLSGIATQTATKKYGRMNAKEDDAKKPESQICHESTANLLAHSLKDKGHSESSISPNGMRSSEAACLTISKTEAPVLENFNEESCSNEAVCITKSSSEVKENVPQNVMIANHGDEGNCVAGGSCGQQDTLKIIFFPDERRAKLANGTFKSDQIRSEGKTAELCSKLKECNDAAWKATEKKLAYSNIDDGRTSPSDMRNPSSKGNPCITSDPAVMLTGPEFVKHMMEHDKAMEKKESEKNDDKVRAGKEGNNLVLSVASKHGTQLSCEVNSQKEMEKVDSIPSPEGNDPNAEMETPTKDSSPCVNASVVGENSESNDAKVNSKNANPVHMISKESEGKSIISSPEVNDLNAPPMQITNGAPMSFHLPSSSGSSALDMVHANSSYVAMDIDLNIPLDVTPINVISVDLGSTTSEASMDRSSEATDSDATMEMICRRPQTTTTTVTTQTSQQQTLMLFGHIIYQAPSTGTANQGNQTVVVSSTYMPSNPVVPQIRPRVVRAQQVYPSWATTTTVWRSNVPNNHQPQGQHQQAMLLNRILYGGSSSNGASSASAASALQLQPGSSALSNNMLINQQRRQALANIAQYSSVMRGGVPVVPSPHLIQGSSGGGGGFINFNGFNSVQQQQQWPYPVVDTSRLVLGLGYPFHYPGVTANQAPATVNTILSIGTGTNNGEGASTSNARAPPAAGTGTNNGQGPSTSNARAPPEAGRGTGTGGDNSWLSLRRN